MAHPEIFYKYTQASTALIVLKTTRLRWSSPLLFDDPAEFKRMPRFEPSIAEAAKAFPATIVHAAIGQFPVREQVLAKNARLLLTMTRLMIERGMSPTDVIVELGEIPEASDDKFETRLLEFFNNKFISTARVVCMSISFDNDALWENYAESFKGCVIGFRHIPKLSTPFLAARKVTYSEHQPVVGSGTDFLLYGDTDQLRRSTIDAVCFTKKHHWAYQQEWRAITWRDEEGEAKFGDYKFYPEELESVTLGLSATADTESAVANLLREIYPNCQLYQLVRENGISERVLVNLHIGA